MRVTREQAGRLGQVLGPATLRAPAAIGNAALERDIEGGAIHSALPASDDFHEKGVALADVYRTLCPRISFKAAVYPGYPVPFGPRIGLPHLLRAQIPGAGASLGIVGVLAHAQTLVHPTR